MGGISLIPGRVVLDTDWQREITPQVLNKFQEVGQSAVVQARRLVPQGSGKLANSIGYAVSAFVGGPGGGSVALDLFATAPYAEFVEYGTGLRGIVTAVQAQTEPLGIRPGYIHGTSPGQAAQPFLRPALLLAVHTRSGNLKFRGAT